jgi:DNA-binding beta-propeller fold protein YncE
MPGMFRNESKVGLLIAVITVMLASCAPQKALIDRSGMDKIIWPGPPERPRITFLWSVTNLSDDPQSRAARFLAGEEDAADSRTSDRFLRPYSIFVDEAGLLYVTDPGAYRVTVIDPKSGDTRHIVETGKEEFLSPVGIAAFRGRIYVSDSGLNKVFIFGPDGKRFGELAGEFMRPTSLAIDRSRGVMYVTDTLAHLVYRYDLDGRRLGVISRKGLEEGEFNYPTHIWVDNKGSLYVTDSMNFRIMIFSPDGTFETMFGRLGDALGELDKPKGVATDGDGNIYVVDSIQDMVKIFNREGKLLLSFGEQGRDFGQFWLPSGIFIDEKNQIYVADTYNGRVQVFKYLGGK